MSTSSRSSTILLWLARGIAAIVVGFVLLMVIGHALTPDEPWPTPVEAMQIALFPFGVCLGLAAAWRWPLAGGAFSLACLWTFVLVMKDRDLIIVGVIFSIPAALFIAAGLLRRRSSRGGAGGDGGG